MPNDGVVLAPISFKEDLELLLAWRSNPEIYKWFYEQDGPLKWKDHYSFWQNKENRKDWLIKYDARKVGSSYVVGTDTKVPDVGIYIGEITLWGQGIGTKALQLTLDWLANNDYVKAQARISKQNKASQKLFQKVGFSQNGEWEEDKDWWLYIIDLKNR